MLERRGALGLASCTSAKVSAATGRKEHFSAPAPGPAHVDLEMVESTHSATAPHRQVRVAHPRPDPGTPLGKPPSGSRLGSQASEVPLCVTSPLADQAVGRSGYCVRRPATAILGPACGGAVGRG